MACSSSVNVTESETSSQRGVGCTHVVKPPWVMRYVLGPSFSIDSPQKYASGSCVPNRLRSTDVRPARLAMPEAMKNVPVRVRVLNSIRSAEIRFSFETNTTWPDARMRSASLKISTSSAKNCMSLQLISTFWMRR